MSQVPYVLPTHPFSVADYILREHGNALTREQVAALVDPRSDSYVNCVCSTYAVKAFEDRTGEPF